MSTLNAVAMHFDGGPEVLEYEDAACPNPNAGEVIGWDVSGVVEILGTGGSRLNAGDDVFSRPEITRDVAYAVFTLILPFSVGD